MAKKLSLLVATTILIGVSAIQASDDASGLRTKLVLLEPTYEIGKPMMLRVELVNVGSAPVPYDSFDSFRMFFAQYNGWLRVKGPGGEAIPYIGLSSRDQTAVGEIASTPIPMPTLKPGRSIPVFTIDLAKAYYIDHPGRYTIQYNGPYIPKSEPIQVVVQSGRLSDADEIVGRLLREFQPDWMVEKILPDALIQEGPFGSQNALVAVRLIKKQDYPHLSLMVWQLRHTVDLTLVQSNSRHVREYLGQNHWGAVYVDDAELQQKELLHVRDRLLRAMEISTDRSRQ